MFGVSLADATRKYGLTIKPLADFGMTKAKHIRDVYSMLSDWMIDTGYPNAPLDVQSKETLVSFWTDFKDKVIEYGFYDDLNQGFLPLNMDPLAAAEMLISMILLINNHGGRDSSVGKSYTSYTRLPALKVIFHQIA